MVTKFQLVPTSEVYTPRPRGTFNIQGHPKSRKTTLALSVNEPIYVFAFEVRTLQTAYIEAKKGRKIYSKNLTGWVDTWTDNIKQQKAQEFWHEFSVDFLQALAHPDIASIVIDPFTLAYDVARMATFGRLSSVPELQYQGLNTEMATILWKADGADKNVVVVNDLADEFVKGADGKSQRTGNYRIDGWATTPKRVQMNIQTWINPVDGSFHAYVLSSGVNSALNGLDLAQMSVPWSLQWLVQCMWNEGVAAMEIQRAVAMRAQEQRG